MDVDERESQEQAVISAGRNTVVEERQRRLGVINRVESDSYIYDSDIPRLVFMVATVI